MVTGISIWVSTSAHSLNCGTANMLELHSIGKLLKKVVIKIILENVYSCASAAIKTFG